MNTACYQEVFPIATPELQESFGKMTGVKQGSPPFAPSPSRPRAIIEIFRQLARYTRSVGPRKARRVVVQAFLRPRRFAAWLQEINDYRDSRRLSESGLHFFAWRPLKAWLRPGLGFEQRLALARSHHALIAQTAPAAMLERLWALQDIRLGEVHGRSGSVFELWLTRSIYPHEGYLQITINRADQGDGWAPPLARLTFSLAATADTGGRKALLIGGLQGGPREVSKTDVVAATRALKGLRPKAAVVLAAQAFADCAGCDAILAVSNTNQLINLRQKRTRLRKLADYDSFWRERGGAPDDWLGFELPLLAQDGRAERRAIVETVRQALAPTSPAERDERASLVLAGGAQP